MSTIDPDQLRQLAAKWQAEAAPLAHHGDSYYDADEQSDDRMADVLTECADALLVLVGDRESKTSASSQHYIDTGEHLPADSSRCPVTGRSASACEDQTHAGCVSGHRAGIAVDRANARRLT